MIQRKVGWSKYRGLSSFYKNFYVHKTLPKKGQQIGHGEVFGSKNRVEENVIYGYTLHGNVAFESWIILSTKNLGYFVMSNAYQKKFTNDVALEICCKMSMKYTANIFDVNHTAFYCVTFRHLILM